MADLDLVDNDGVTLRRALANFGGDLEGLGQARRKPDDTVGFLEAHIEQGAVLERTGNLVGVMSAICGIEHWTARLGGKAGHTGTTPMDMRHDGLAGAT